MMQPNLFSSVLDYTSALLVYLIAGQSWSTGQEVGDEFKERELWTRTKRSVPSDENKE